MEKNINESSYRPLDENSYENLWKKHSSTIETFIKNNNYDINCIYINQKTILEIISRVDQRRNYYKFFMV